MNYQNILKEKRETSGYTMQDIADKLGCSRAYVKYLETIEYNKKPPTYDHATKLISIYKMTDREAASFMQSCFIGRLSTDDIRFLDWLKSRNCKV